MATKSVTLAALTSTMDPNTSNLYFSVSVSGFSQNDMVTTATISANTGLNGSTKKYKIPVSQLMSLFVDSKTFVYINDPSLSNSNSSYQASIKIVVAGDSTAYRSDFTTFQFKNFENILPSPRLLSTISLSATSFSITVASKDISGNNINASTITFSLSNTKTMLPDVTRSWAPSASDLTRGYSVFTFTGIPEDSLYQASAYFANITSNPPYVDSESSNVIAAYPSNQPDKPTSVSYDNSSKIVSFTSSTDADVLKMLGVVLDISGIVQYYQFNSDNTFTKVANLSSATGYTMQPAARYSFTVVGDLSSNTNFVCTLAEVNTNGLGLLSNTFNMFTGKDLGAVPYSYSPILFNDVNRVFNKLNTELNFGNSPSVNAVIDCMGLTAFDVSFSNPVATPVLTSDLSLNYNVLYNYSMTSYLGLAIAAYKSGDYMRPPNTYDDEFLSVEDYGKSPLTYLEGVRRNITGVISSKQGFTHQVTGSIISSAPTLAYWCGTPTYNTTTGKFNNTTPAISDDDKLNVFCGGNTVLFYAMNVYFGAIYLNTQSGILGSKVNKDFSPYGITISGDASGTYVMSEKSLYGHPDVPATLIWAPGTLVSLTITPILSTIAGDSSTSSKTIFSVQTTVPPTRDISDPDDILLTLSATGVTNDILFTFDVYYFLKTFGLPITTYKLTLYDFDYSGDNLIGSQQLSFTSLTDPLITNDAGIRTTVSVNPNNNPYKLVPGTNYSVVRDILPLIPTKSPLKKLINGHRYKLTISMSSLKYPMDSTQQTLIDFISSEASDLVSYERILAGPAPTLTLPGSASNATNNSILFTWRAIASPAELNGCVLNNYLITLIDNDNNNSVVGSYYVSPENVKEDNTFSYLFTNGIDGIVLVNGHNYYGTVVRTASFGLDSNESPAGHVLYNHYGPMAKVENVSVANNIGYLTVTWNRLTLVSQTNGSVVGKYLIVLTRQSDGTTYSFDAPNGVNRPVVSSLIISPDLTGNNEASTDTLLDGETYNVTVLAIASFGENSPESDPVPIAYYYPPSSPFAVNLEVVKNTDYDLFGFNISWNAPAIGTPGLYLIKVISESGIERLYQIGAESVSSESPSLEVLSPYNVFTLPFEYNFVAGQKYAAQVKVISINDVHSEWSELSPYVTYFKQINAVQNLTLKLVSNTIAVAWLAPVGNTGLNLNAYKVELIGDDESNKTFTVLASEVSSVSNNNTDRTINLNSMDLVKGVTYSVNLSAINTQHRVADSIAILSDPILYAGPIDAVQNISLVLEDDFSITIGWENGQSNNGSTPGNYNIVITDSSSNEVMREINVPTSPVIIAPNVVNSLLTTGKLYKVSITVNASKGFDSASNSSTSLYYYTSIDTPEPMLAIENGDLQVTWDTQALNLNGSSLSHYVVKLYELVDSDTILAATGASETGNYIFGLTADSLKLGSTYAATVQAKAASGADSNISALSNSVLEYIAPSKVNNISIVNSCSSDGSNAHLEVRFDVPDNDGIGGSEGANIAFYKITVSEFGTDNILDIRNVESAGGINYFMPNINANYITSTSYIASVIAYSEQELASQESFASSPAVYALPLVITSVSAGNPINSEFPLTINYSNRGSIISSIFAAVVTDNGDIMRIVNNISDSTSSPYVLVLSSQRIIKRVIGGLVVVTDSLGFISYSQFGSNLVQ